MGMVQVTTMGPHSMTATSGLTLMRGGRFTRFTTAQGLYDDAVLRIEATARVVGRTGVEMEALTAVAVAGLTVIDMVKAVDPHAALRDVLVEAKDGGRSGSWTR